MANLESIKKDLSDKVKNSTFLGAILAGTIYTISAIGLIGCASAIQQQKNTYFTGRVKSENFTKGMASSDVYTFTLETDKGLKMFYNYYSAQELNALVDKDDKVKIKLNLQLQELENDKFYIDYRDLIEINEQDPPKL